MFSEELLHTLVFVVIESVGENRILSTFSAILDKKGAVEGLGTNCLVTSTQYHKTLATNFLSIL